MCSYKLNRSGAETVPVRRPGKGSSIVSKGTKFALLLAGSVIAIPGVASAQKVFLLGVDGCDPNLLRQYMDEGLLPNYKRLADGGSFMPCETSMPPQSPVAWSSVITGLDPGGHGIFDFIHRRPESYLPFLSTSEARPPENTVELFGYTLPIPLYSTPAETVNLRKGVPFWDYVAQAGFETTIFKMPANYPPSDFGTGRAISDMGTPDVIGTYGTFSYYTDVDTKKPVKEISAGNIHRVEIVDDYFEAEILGPPDSFRSDSHETPCRFEAILDRNSETAAITVGGERVLLREGEWSDWVVIPFEFSLMQSMQGIARFYLQEVSPNFRLYVSPVNFDPCADAGATTTPSDYAEELCEKIGRFYTQGMPEETKALEGWIFSNEEFLQQRRIVFDERRLQLDVVLDEYRARENGMTFFYFGSVDQTSHMMWRTMDETHPARLPEDAASAAGIRDTYVLTDEAIGKVIDAVGDEGTLILISDHGFSPWHRSVHLNTWLKENGYLAVTDPNNYGEGEFLSEVNFWKTKAYAIGINSLYINQRGREGKGTVSAGAAKEALMSELVEKLEAAVDPESGARVFEKVYRREEIYHGAHVENAPDLLVGYGWGYRGSDESAKGQVVNGSFVAMNDDKKWTGDHCVDYTLVPGVILSNKKIKKSDPALVDIAPTVLSEMGIAVPSDMVGESVF
ncbi:MAG: hypothetical protein CME06_05715 [Gemmatimonadetes bacterium]|nr:hypothetical protein [Gemmatimonadota bacterium]